jgi:hypothetical protein
VDAGLASYHIHKVLSSCDQGIEVMREHQQSLFDLGLVTLQPSLSNNAAHPGDWELFKMEQTVLKVAAEQDCSRGVLYFLAVPLSEGKWMLRFVFDILKPCC